MKSRHDRLTDLRTRVDEMLAQVRKLTLEAERIIGTLEALQDALLAEASKEANRNMAEG